MSNTIREISTIRIVPSSERKGGRVVRTSFSLVAITTDNEELLAPLTREAGIELTKHLAKSFGVRLAHIRGERIFLRDAMGRPTGSLDIG